MLLFCVMEAGAQWRTGGVSICDTSSNSGLDLGPRLAPDSKGGAYICWQDYRAGDADIFAQHVDSMGRILWQRNGISIAATPEQQAYPRIVADGAGGAIIAWEDDRTDVETYVYAQRIDPFGQSLWPLNGVKVASKGGLFVSIDSDGIGGALIGWSTVYDITVQKLDSLGNRVWGDSGVQVSTRSGSVYPGDIWIVSDGAKGAIVAWSEGSFPALGVYAQRIDSSGIIAWREGGILLSDSVSSNNGVAICSDGAGGGIVDWGNETQALSYAQRVDEDGMIAWAPGGTALGNLAGGGAQRNISDGVGGAFIGHGRYVQHLDRLGKKLWRSAGVQYTFNSTRQSTQARTSEGGMWNFWQNFIGGAGFHIYGQWIDSSGRIRWGETGTPISSVDNYQELPFAVADGYGHALVCWGEGKGASFHGSSVYCAKVDTNGVFTSLHTKTGNSAPTMPRLDQNYPNPFNSETTVSFYLPSQTHVNLTVFDCVGRETTTLLNEVKPVGNHFVRIDLHDKPSGVYFYRLLTRSSCKTNTMLLIR